MVLSWMSCIYMTESGRVQVRGLGLPPNHCIVYKTTADPSQPYRWLLAMRGFWCGAGDVVTHGASSEHFHRAALLRAGLLTVRKCELSLHPLFCDVVRVQPWAMLLSLPPLFCEVSLLFLSQSVVSDMQKYFILFIYLFLLVAFMTWLASL